MNKNYVFLKAKKLRRIGASIIDLIIAFSLSILIYLVLEPFKYNNDNYLNALNYYNEMLVNSSLYEYETDSTLTTISSDYETHFIEFFKIINKDLDEYLNPLKSESNLFNEDYSLKDEYTYESQEVINFYNKALNSLVISDYFNKDYYSLFDKAKESYNIVTVFQIGMLALSLLIGTLIYYVIFSLINKDSLTFGKMIFKLKIYSKKGCLKVSKIQILFRELIYIFFELFLSIYSIIYLKGFPLPLIISLICLFFFKDSASFHDLLTSTFVVDDNTVTNNTPENMKLFISFKDENNGK